MRSAAREKCEGELRLVSITVGKWEKKKIYQVAINIAGDKGMLLICAINIADIASYRAPPSMFTVAPRGNTNLLIRSSTLLFSSRQRIVVGNVAELKEKDKNALKIRNIKEEMVPFSHSKFSCFS